MEVAAVGAATILNDRKAADSSDALSNALHLTRFRCPDCDSVIHPPTDWFAAKQHCPNLWFCPICLVHGFVSPSSCCRHIHHDHEQNGLPHSAIQASREARKRALEAYLTTLPAAEQERIRAIPDVQRAYHAPTIPGGEQRSLCAMEIAIACGMLAILVLLLVIVFVFVPEPVSKGGADHVTMGVLTMVPLVAATLCCCLCHQKRAKGSAQRHLAQEYEDQVL